MMTNAPTPMATPMSTGLPVVRIMRDTLWAPAGFLERRAIMGGGPERRVPLESPERVEREFGEGDGAGSAWIGGKVADAWQTPEPGRTGAT
jgi:hypothetical protein